MAAEQTQMVEADKLKVKKDQLTKAIRALHQVVAKRTANSNNLLGDSAETMILQFTLSQVPDKKRMRPVMIPLPHPMYTEKSECCFISKDPQKKYKELLMEKSPVPGITKVIGIGKLRKNYKTLEAKKALADSFDLFMCDASVAEMMPKLLGSTFYERKKKAPLPVKMQAGEKFQENLKKAMAGTPLRRPTGACIAVKIGKCAMGEEELVANAVAVIKGFVANVKGNPVRSISVQATDAPALPVWRRAAAPGAPVDLKKFREDGLSSAASETGASGISDAEGSVYSTLPSDAGETLSTRGDTVSEPDTTGGDISVSELESEASEAGDVDDEPVKKEDMPLIQSLKKKTKRKAAALAGTPVPAKPAEKAAEAPKKEAMGPPAKKAKKGKH